MQSLVDQTAQADQARTQRAFVGFLASALGTDQNYAGEDNTVDNTTQTANIIANPDGTYSVIGKPSSNLQTQGATNASSLSPLVLLIGAGILAFYLLKK